MTIDTDEFVQGYLDGILFTESAADSDPDRTLLDVGCDRDDFTAEAVATLREDCEAFIEANQADLIEYCLLRGGMAVPRDVDLTKRAEMAQAVWMSCAADSFGRTSYSAAECAGTDFWLSRNGHGAGYSDRGDEPTFRRLQDAARVYGEQHVWFDGERIEADR